MDHFETPSPNATFTTNQLTAATRKLAGTRRAPIGVRTIRAAIAAKELRAAFVNNRPVIQWSDYLAWLDSRKGAS